MLGYTAGTVSEDLYLQGDSYFPALGHLEELPKDSTVQFMWEPKTYYCPDTITCIPDVLFDNWSRPLILGTEPDALMQQWRDAGVDYLLVYGLQTEYDVGYDFWLNQHESTYDVNSRFPDTLDNHMTRIWDDGKAYALYEWRD